MKALSKPGVPFVVAGAAVFAVGVFMGPTKGFERLALLAAVLAAAAEAIRMIVT